MKTIIKYLLFIIFILGVGTLFYKKVYIPKSTYTTVTSLKGDLDVKVYGIGNVGANHIYKINSQIGGKILSITTDEGKWVKKGELLVTFDTVDLPKLLDEAKISIDKAKSELIASKKELDTLLSQKELSFITYKRYKKLRKQAFVSKAEFDKVKTDLDVINSQINVTKAHINSAKIEILRTVKGKEAIEEKLKLYKIYSPIDGYVIARYAEVEQSLAPSQTILEIVDPNSVWVKTFIDERVSGMVKIGQKAQIKLRSSKKEFNGEVIRIVAQSDLVTQEREIDVSFNKLPIPFYINEQAEVSIFSKHYTGVIKIPAKALNYYNEQKGVWIKKDNKAHFIPIDIIARSSNEVAVSNVKEGETLLIETSKNRPLKEGSSVN